MKHWKKVIAMLMAATVVLGGCGDSSSGEENQGGSETEKENGTESNEPGQDSSTDGAGESSEGKLVIYSPQGDSERGGWFIEKCKEDTGIDIEFLASGGGELEERLIAEKQNPQADVVFGLGQMSMYNLKAEDILEPYTPAWAEGLDEVYKDKDGAFYCFWQTPIVIAYNTDYIDESEAPKDWLDLDSEQYKEMFTMGSIKSQTTRSMLAGILWNYYDEGSGDITEEGWDKLTAIYANTQTLPTGSDAWQMVKEGVTPLMLNWFGGVKSNAEQNEIPIAYVVPENGTPVVSEGIGIVKGTENLEAAKEFVEWFGSPEVMAEYANEFGQAPAHPEAIALCNDEVKADASMFTAQEIDWEVVSTKMNDWLTKIELDVMP